jgi:hypothetical protein
MSPDEAADVLAQCELLERSIMQLKAKALGILDAEALSNKEPHLKLVRSKIVDFRQGMGTN